MKLTKADYMRLPKERLAELLVERDNEKVDPIVIPPSTPSIPYDPWNPFRYPYGPVITYATETRTNDTSIKEDEK